MLTINSIKNGIVIDHIKAGCGMKIFRHLGLEQVDFTVALIMNVESSKLGRKDLIKIETKLDVDFTILGLIDPNITINIIEEHKLKEKIALKLPKEVKNAMKCKNPRCITTIEPNVTHSFYLVDDMNAKYRCSFCDEIHSLN